MLRSTGVGDATKSRKRGFAAPWGACASLAGAAYGEARGGGWASHRSSLWAQRILAPARTPLLVPVFWGRHGHGLAFLRHYDQRHRRAETRPLASRKRAWHPHLRWPRQALASNPA